MRKAIKLKEQSDFLPEIDKFVECIVGNNNRFISEANGDKESSRYFGKLIPTKRTEEEKRKLSLLSY